MNAGALQFITVLAMVLGLIAFATDGGRACRADADTCFTSTNR